MATPGMYGRLGKVPRRTQSNRTVQSPTSATSGTLGTYDQNAFGSSPYTFDYPEDLLAGDVIILAVCTTGTSQGHDTPSGFTQLTNDQWSVVRYSTYYKVATASDISSGSGSGTTTGSLATGMWYTTRVRPPSGVSYSTSPPEASSTAGDADPPVIAPSGVPGTYVVLATIGTNDTDTTVPTNYTEHGGSYDEDAGGGAARLYVAQRSVEITTNEDPSTFFSGGTPAGNDRVVATIAVVVSGTGSVASGGHTHNVNDADDVGTGATTKGDLLVHDGTDYERLAVGSDGTFLKANSGQTLGVEWAAGGAVTDINDLGDVTITTAADNEVLAYDNGTSEWINQTAAEAGLSATGHSHTESDITDLDHDDTDAIHDNVSGEIAAVTEKASPVNADLVLIEDSEASNAKKRVQLGNLPGGGGASALDDLSDVTITTPSTNEVLKYNGTTWVNDTDSTGSGLPTGTTAGDLAVYNGTSWVRIGAGTNDHVLTADSGQTEGIKWAAASGGSGGKSYITGPADYPPDTAHGSNDEFDQANGTDPTAGSWAWFNQSTATAQVDNGRLVFDSNGATSTGLRGLAVAAPTGDFTVDAHVGALLRANYHGIAVGLLWGTLATPTNTIEGVRLFYNSRPRIYATAFNTSFVPSTDRAFDNYFGGNRAFLRCGWDSSAQQVTYAYSVSGIKGTWRQFWSHNTSSYGDPDFMWVGIITQGQETLGDAAWFRVNWTPDFDASTDN